MEQVIAGRYRLAEQIASSPGGELWRAHDTSLDQVVAVKLLEPEHGDERAVAAMNTQRMAHPSITAVRDVGRDNGRPYVVAELVEGTSLRARLDSEGAMPVHDAVRIAQEVLLALHHAHERGVHHGDVHPGNVLLTESGMVKVSDFGGRGDDMGAGPHPPLAYRAPELLEKGGEPTRHSDVYATGAVLYAMLTGSQPFAAASRDALASAIANDTPAPVRSRRPTVPAHLDTVVLRAMARQPADRYDSAMAMARDLDTALPATVHEHVERTVEAERPVPRRSPAYLLREAPGMWMALGALAALAVGLTVLVILLGWRATQPEPTPAPQPTPLIIQEQQPAPPPPGVVVITPQPVQPTPEVIVVTPQPAPPPDPAPDPDPAEPQPVQ